MRAVGLGCAHVAPVVGRVVQHQLHLGDVGGVVPCRMGGTSHTSLHPTRWQTRAAAEQGASHRQPDENVTHTRHRRPPRSRGGCGCTCIRERESESGIGNAGRQAQAHQIEKAAPAVREAGGHSAASPMPGGTCMRRQPKASQASNPWWPHVRRERAWLCSRWVLPLPHGAGTPLTGSTLCHCRCSGGAHGECVLG